MPIILAVIVILIDQISKLLYVSVFNAPNITLIKWILNLTYVENRGAAWGMFANNQIWLYVFSGIMVLIILLFFILNYKKMNKLLRYSIALILSGAVGNMIDRLFLGYVRDMLEFGFVEFPVFNIADAAITIGAVLLAIDCLFFEKDKSKNKSNAELTGGNEDTVIPESIGNTEESKKDEN